ncbi:MAG: polyprenyl synthetase family protein [Deltaproteobacteria bacterium]|nr:polyprenyl synthetase family protein [Deltaproteobacteria bacterium]
MELERYLAEKREVIETGLRSLLPGKDEHPRSLHNAMHYSLFAGGKRIRPVLTLASAEAVGGAVEDAINIACAIECIHTYSLIHDDLPAIDNDDLRRGRPTCHKVFGEATAILAGDALLTLAFELIGKAPRQTKAALKVLTEIARAAGSTGMIGGQAVDVDSEGREVDYPTLEYIHIHKTGALIRASVRCGAIAAGAKESELRPFTRYAEAVGLAFQIADDILDVEGSSVEMGKNAGGDIKKGKATYPSLVGVKESRRRAGELVDMAVAALDAFDEKAEPLRRVARYIVARRK